MRLKAAMTVYAAAKTVNKAAMTVNETAITVNEAVMTGVVTTKPNVDTVFLK